MKFKPLDYETLRQELRHLPAEGTDETSVKVTGLTSQFVKRCRKLSQDEVSRTLIDLLTEDVDNLDVIRLFMGLSQDRAAHALGSGLGVGGDYAAVKRQVRNRPKDTVDALKSLGVLETIITELDRRWTVTDVLMERYKMSRGRALAGQQRGRALENQVQAILDGLAVPYQARCTFDGKGGIRAKADFAIPSAKNPKIVIEVKGFEATGSKQTDVLGDISKIGEARGNHMYFFVVTDGLGWLNRHSDLKALIMKHQGGDIDMIFTSSRLHDLAEAVAHIMTHEAQ